jgi:hypothetical protein
MDGRFLYWRWTRTEHSGQLLARRSVEHSGICPGHPTVPSVDYPCGKQATDGCEHPSTGHYDSGPG